MPSAISAMTRATSAPVIGSAAGSISALGRSARQIVQPPGPGIAGRGACGDAGLDEIQDAGVAHLLEVERGEPEPLLQPGTALGRQFRQLVSYLLDVVGSGGERREVGLREVPVVGRLFLAAPGRGGALTPPRSVGSPE